MATPCSTKLLERAQSPFIDSEREPRESRESMPSPSSIPAEGDAAELEQRQSEFRSAVTAEVVKLQASGLDRAAAVKILLRRIAGDFSSPRQREVQSVIDRYGISRLGAMRALIVKQEIGRLKRGGLDTLSAIEELTFKMKGCAASSPAAPQQAEERARRARGCADSSPAAPAAAPAQRRRAAAQQRHLFAGGGDKGKKDKGDKGRKRFLAEGGSPTGAGSGGVRGKRLKRGGGGGGTGAVEAGQLRGAVGRHGGGGRDPPLLRASSATAKRAASGAAADAPPSAKKKKRGST